MHGEALACLIQRVVLKGFDDTLATPVTEMMEEDLSEIKIKPLTQMNIDEERNLQNHLIESRLGVRSLTVPMSNSSASLECSSPVAITRAFQTYKNMASLERKSKTSGSSRSNNLNKSCIF